MDIPLSIEPAAGAIYGQIRSGIQTLIVEGKLGAGTSLPAVRVLARQLGVNALTVLRAYHELEAMGYLEMEVGIGTRVSRKLPDEFLKARPTGPRKPGVSGGVRRLLPPGSPRALALDFSDYIGAQGRTYRLNFDVSKGDLRLFPVTVWRRLYLKRLRALEGSSLDYAGSQGAEPLLDALQTQILPARGIQAGSDEILITTGSIQAIHYCLDLLLAPGTPVAVEDPGYLLYRKIVALRGGRAVPVPAVAGGIDVGRLRSILRRKALGAAILTPSHQFPTTATLDFAGRKALLETLGHYPTWILEDDYDNEFHYDSPPLPSLRSLETAGKVLYFGTFSKVLFPDLRIGYVVGPGTVIRQLKSLVFTAGFHGPILNQLVASDFIRHGHYDAHIRRMRRIYARRRDALAEATRRHLPGFAFALPKGGMRMWIQVPGDVDAERLSAKLRHRGILAQTGRVHFLKPPGREFLHLGFAALNESEIEEGVRAIRNALPMARRQGNRGARKPH